jgi:hypothetical protein
MSSPFSNSYNSLSDLSLLKYERSPVKIYQDHVFVQNLPPESASDGVSTNENISCVVGFDSVFGESRSCRLKILDLLAPSYGVVLYGAGAVTVAPGLTIEDTVDSLLLALEGSFYGSLGFSFEKISEDTISIYSDYNFGEFYFVSDSQSILSDANFCEFVVWGFRFDKWEEVESGNRAKTVDCSSFSRVYVQVLRCNNRCIPFVAPFVLDNKKDYLNDFYSDTNQQKVDLYNTFPASVINGYVADEITSTEGLPLVPSDGFSSSGFSKISISMVSSDSSDVTLELHLFENGFWSKYIDFVYTGSNQLLHSEIPKCSRIYLRVSQNSFPATIYRKFKIFS